MVHLFPHIKEQINSNKTPENIYMILKSVTDSQKTLFSSSAEFAGQVHPLDFRIVLRVNYRNSFLPIITGKIMGNEEETVIDMKAEMPIFTRVFFFSGLVWLVSFFCVGLLLFFQVVLKK